MLDPSTIASLALLTPLAAAITYTDIRYRRIPNTYVLATLVSGLILNIIFGGVHGLLASLGGCAFAFALMLVLHVFGAMGAGDVKLFAAIGAVIGLSLVLPTFGIVLLTGFVMAVFTMVRHGIARATLLRVLSFFVGALPGNQLPKFTASTDRRFTLPYGVAITLGSLISLVIFHA